MNYFNYDTLDRRVTLEQFRTFVAIADHGSFIAAAQGLLRTQSAVTHQLRSLEKTLGQRLIIRSRGHFGGLTTEGEWLLPQARRILGSVATVCRYAQEPSLAGHVRIGVMDDFEVDGLIELIARFRSLHPDAEVSTISDISARIEARMARGEIDIALIKRVCGTEQKPGEVLNKERLQWVAGEVFDLPAPGESIPLVLFHEGCVYRSLTTQKLDEMGLRWHTAYAGHSYSNVRAAISAGLGVSILPERQIMDDHIVLEDIGPKVTLSSPGYTELILQSQTEISSQLIAAFKREVELCPILGDGFDQAERRSVPDYGTMLS